MRTKLANYLSAGKHAFDFYASFTIIPFFLGKGDTGNGPLYPILGFSLKMTNNVFTRFVYNNKTPHGEKKRDAWEYISANPC